MPTKQDTCPKCGSIERIRGVQVMTIGDGQRVVTKVNRRPRAVFLKGATTSPLKATVCGHCGFTELYVSEPDELLSAYRQGEAT